MLRNRFLGGVSFLPLFSPVDGAGAGAAAAGTAAGAAAPAAGAGDPAAGAAKVETVSTVADPAAGAAAAEPGAAAGATLAAGGADPGKQAAAAAAAPAGFPENWREIMAGGDKQLLTDLAKYTTPDALYKSLRDVQTKISKGELKAPPAPLAKDATPEQAAEYRKANGLPDSAEGYVAKLELPEGIVIGEADKPLVASFAKSMFEQGATQGEMNRAVSWFYSQQAQVEQQRSERDGETKQTAMSELMTEWGPGDYKTNMQAVGSFLAAVPEELRVEMLTARTADGRMLGNTAAFNKFAAEMARQINPAATLVPAGDSNALGTISDQIKAIESKMYLDGKPNPEYWKGESGKAMQAKYRELTDARDALKSRGGKAA